MSAERAYTESETSRHVTAGSLRLHYNELGIAGTPVIFLHGGGPGCTGWSDFRCNAPAFAAAGYHCYLLDFPMYGRSDKPVIEGGRFTYLSRSLADFMAALNIPKAMFVTQSLGGCVALRLAIDRPELVDCLVMTGSQPVLHGVHEPLRGARAFGQRIGSDYYGGDGPTPEKMRTLIADYEWFDPKGIPDETVEIRYRASMEEGAEKYRTNPASRGRVEDLTSEFVKNHARTLIISGQGDWFGGLDIPLLMFNRFPDARFYMIQRTGHHLQEEQPELYNRLVLNFLQEGELGRLAS